MTCVCVHHTSWPVRSRDTYTETCRERHNFQSELSGAFPRLFSCMCVTTLSSFLSHCTHILSVRVCLSLSLSLTHYARLARPLSSLHRSCFSPFSFSFPSFTTHAYISADIILFYHSHIHDIPHAAVSLYLHGGCVCVCVRLHTL